MRQHVLLSTGIRASACDRLLRCDYLNRFCFEIRAFFEKDIKIIQYTCLISNIYNILNGVKLARSMKNHVPDLFSCYSSQQHNMYRD